MDIKLEALKEEYIKARKELENMEIFKSLKNLALGDEAGAIQSMVKNIDVTQPEYIYIQQVISHPSKKELQEEIIHELNNKFREDAGNKIREAQKIRKQIGYGEESLAPLTGFIYLYEKIKYIEKSLKEQFGIRIVEDGDKKLYFLPSKD